MDNFLTKRRFLNDNLDILVEGCRNNNLQSQHELYKLCYPNMIKVCFRYAPDADGAGTIYNDAMLKVFKNIHKYTDEGKLLGWIKTIVINCSTTTSDQMLTGLKFEKASATELKISLSKLDQ